MKYPIYKRLPYLAFLAMDTLLKALPLRRNFPIAPPKKILIVNLAHLGDVILTTALLEPLKRAFPNAEIGMLVGSWSKAVVEHHPAVCRLHYLNHWKINRTQQKGYFQMRRKVLQEIKGYDVAIDVSFHFPNTAPLLWQARIPVRIGFSSAGFGPLLTHSLPWQPENRSAALFFLSLLQFLGIHEEKPRPSLAVKPVEKEDYIVIHMGAGADRKEWEPAKWRELINRFKGSRLIFTGRGPREKDLIRKVLGDDYCEEQDYCDRLSWQDFVTVIQKAQLLVCVDTSAGHVAAAVGTAVVVLFTGVNPLKMWSPCGDQVHALTGKVACSPCYKGCATMQCMEQLSVDEVEAATKAASLNVGV